MHSDEKISERIPPYGSEVVLLEDEDSASFALKEEGASPSASRFGFLPCTTFSLDFTYGEDAAAREAYLHVLSVLPEGMRREISRIERSFKHFPARLRELRVRVGGVSSLTVGGTRMPLSYRVRGEEAEGMLRAMTRGALYAFRSQMSRGYLTPWEGVRVGVVGERGAEGEAISSLGAISSFVFRIPHAPQTGGASLREFFLSSVNTGWLLLSPPGVGKTTALRLLGRALGRGEGARLAVAVDERGEFLRSDAGGSLDVLSGYARAEGMEIALRTLGAEVLLVDEIGARRDAEILSEYLLAGVPVVATAHAKSLAEAERRPLLAPLFSLGAFDAVSVLSSSAGGVLFQNYIKK